MAIWKMEECEKNAKFEIPRSVCNNGYARMTNFAKFELSGPSG